MNTVGRKRMLKLIDFLKRLKANKVPGMHPKRFDMRVWKATGEGVKTPCGTAACAVGLIQDAMPGVRDFKFKPHFSENGSTRMTFYPVYKGEEGIWAVNKFFDTSMSDSLRLFTVDYYDHHTPPILTNVIKRLERFVKEQSNARV